MRTENVLARIRQIIDENGFTQNEFADRICIDRSNLSKHLNGKLPVSDSLINKIVVNLGISKKWLLKGEGEQHLFPAQHTDNKVITVSSVEIQNGERHGAQVYDIDVTAGPKGRDILFTTDNLIGTIDVPFIHPEAKVVRVSGDSMFPILQNGDMIAIRPVKNLNLIFWGQIYVVLLDDYRMVKYIRRHKNPDLVILRSENTHYDDIEIPRSEIRSLFLVENVIRFDVRI